MKSVFLLLSLLFWSFLGSGRGMEIGDGGCLQSELEQQQRQQQQQQQQQQQPQQPQQQQQGSQGPKIKKELDRWIAKLKNPKLEFPTFVDDSDNDVIKHWLDSCREGDLGPGLRRNRAGNIEGRGEVVFGDKTTCFKVFNVVRVDGTFVDGLLDGMASVHFKNSSFFVAPFRDGSVSGLSRTFDCRYGHCDYEDPESWNIPNWLSEVRLCFKVQPGLLNRRILGQRLRTCNLAITRNLKLEFENSQRKFRLGKVGPG